MPFSPTFYSFLPFGSKYYPKHPLFEQPQSVFFPPCNITSAYVEVYRQNFNLLGLSCSRRSDKKTPQMNGSKFPLNLILIIFFKNISVATNLQIMFSCPHVADIMFSCPHVADIMFSCPHVIVSRIVFTKYIVIYFCQSLLLDQRTV